MWVNLSAKPFLTALGTSHSQTLREPFQPPSPSIMGVVEGGPYQQPRPTFKLVCRSSSSHSPPCCILGLRLKTPIPLRGGVRCWDRVLLYSPGWPWTLSLIIPQPLKCWGSMVFHIIPFLLNATLVFFFFFSIVSCFCLFVFSFYFLF